MRVESVRASTTERDRILIVKGKTSCEETVATSMQRYRL